MFSKTLSQFVSIKCMSRRNYFFFCVTHCTAFLDSVVETHFLCQTVSRSSIRAELGGYVTVLDDTELEDEFGS